MSVHGNWAEVIKYLFFGLKLGLAETAKELGVLCSR